LNLTTTKNFHMMVNMVTKSELGCKACMINILKMKTRQNITAIIKDKRGRVLSIGKNQYDKSHPLQARLAERVGLKEKIYLHAEVDAIIKCRDLTRAHKIEIFRTNRQGKPMLASPCPICKSAIEAAGIKVVEHT